MLRYVDMCLCFNKPEGGSHQVLTLLNKVVNMHLFPHHWKTAEDGLRPSACTQSC